MQSLQASVSASPLDPEFLRAQDAQIWFSRLGGKEASACFTEQAIDRPQPARGDATKVVRAVRVLVDVTVQVSGLRTLRKGGAVICTGTDTFYAMQPEHFTQRFSRCLSDGVPITRLSDSLSAQTKAIAQCNTVLRERTARQGGTNWFKFLFGRAAVIREGALLLTWGDDLARHIADLHFMAQPVAVPSSEPMAVQDEA